MFVSFALSPRSGGVMPAQAAEEPEAAPPPAALPTPPAVPPLPPVIDPQRDTWAASIYYRLAGSPALSLELDPQNPTVPVILHPSAPRGGTAPPITARHLGILRVDLTGAGVGPGRFFPLFPADDAEEEAGVDTGSLDRFGCSGHWASSGCIRLLTCSSTGASSGTAHTGAGCGSQANVSASNDRGNSSSSSSSGSGGGGDGTSAARLGGLTLMPLPAFAALWQRRTGHSAGSSGSSSQCTARASDLTTSQGAASCPTHSCCFDDSWEVPYARLLPLEEAYGGLARELKAAGADLSRAHYMLRGWKTREGRPRLGASGPRAPAAGQRPRRGVVPAELAATRDLRAMMSWPGLLELLEEEEVAVVPTDGVRYWLARLGGGFHARLAAAGVLCSDATVHHIIARSNRGIDHPLNYFLVDRGPNSAMGSRVEGFRDAHGNKLHMRDVVGERAFEVAQAACNLYHGVLYAGRRRGTPLRDSLRELREGAFALAEEALEAARAREAKRAARGGAGVATPCVAAAAGASEEAAATGRQGGDRQQEEAGEGECRRSLKRERGGEWAAGGSRENTPVNAQSRSPSQQQQERRRRLSRELSKAAEASLPSLTSGVPEAAAAQMPAQTASGLGELAAGEIAEEGLAGLSLCGSPEAPILQAAQTEQKQQQQPQKDVQHADGPVADFASLRARLQAALGSGLGG